MVRMGRKGSEEEKDEDAEEKARRMIVEENRQSEHEFKREAERDEKARQMIVEENRYYHGFLPREEAQAFLKHDGDFLVRAARVRQEKLEVVLSVMWREKFRHMVVGVNGRGYFTVDADKSFQNVQDLIYFYTERTGREAALNNDIRIVNPIPLTDWEVLPQQLTLSKKLKGRVWMGGLRKRGEERKEGAEELRVAVKSWPAGDGKSRAHLQRIARLSRTIHHPYLTKILGIGYMHEPTVIVSEWADGGTVEEMMGQVRRGEREPMGRQERLGLCADLASALVYLHGQRMPVVHLKIRHKECLLSTAPDGSRLCLRLKDLGEGIEMEFENVTRADVPFPLGSAPELLAQPLEISTKADIWSFAIFVSAIFHDTKQPTEYATSAKLREELRSRLQEATKKVEGGLGSLLYRALSPKYTERPPADEFLSCLQAELITPSPIYDLF